MHFTTGLVLVAYDGSTLPRDDLVTREELEALTQRVNQLAEQLRSSAVDRLKRPAEREASGSTEQTAKPRAPRPAIIRPPANLSLCPEKFNATPSQTTASYVPLCGGPETLASGIQCGSMPCTNFQRAWFNRTMIVAERIANASLASPARSMAELRARCDGTDGRGRLMKHVRPLLLRVPKAASTLMLHSFAQACNFSGWVGSRWVGGPTALWDHQAPPLSSCKEASAHKESNL